jgi:hypothetical protein
VVAVSPGHPPIPGGEEPGPVAGLARQVDALRRQVEPLTELRERVDDLAGLLAELTETVTALTARRGPTPCPSWLVLPTDDEIARRALGELVTWLEIVYLCYPDAAQGLPECWCWHPDVVEELLWLMHAWLAAYQGTAASVGLAADWHDRHRPGVVRRLRGSVGSCSIEAHQTREGWPRETGAPPIVPGVEALPLIARWWGSHRHEDAPEPVPITRACRP